MSNIITEELVNRLATAMRRDENSNNYKILSLAANRYDEQISTLDLMKAWLDVDQAQGTTLDMIGKGVGQLRGSMNDETYRKYIKLKIRTNLSKGDIETLNEIGTLLLGDLFDGILEGNMYNIYHSDIPNREASLLFILNGNEPINNPSLVDLERLVAGGVRSNIEILYRPKIKLKVEYSGGERPPQDYIRPNEYETQSDIYTTGGKIK